MPNKGILSMQFIKHYAILLVFTKSGKLQNKLNLKRKTYTMEFLKSDKMAFLIQSNYHLLPVFHRFGFKLGVKNQTVEQLCEAYHVNTDFFITIVNTFHNQNYFPEKELFSFSPLLIIDYLKKTHRFYIEYSLPRIEELLQNFISGNDSLNEEKKMIQEFYKRYKAKLLFHIQDEETKAFPYVEKLVNTPENITDKDFAVNFEDDHESVDLEIDDLKNLILKYISFDYDELVANELLTAIFRFEKDILDHSRIEDAILVPQIRQLQSRL